MLDRSDLLDAKHLRRRSMLYYQSIRPCVYKESTFGHNCGTDMYFVEQRSRRCRRDSRQNDSPASDLLVIFCGVGAVFLYYLRKQAMNRKSHINYDKY